MTLRFALPLLRSCALLVVSSCATPSSTSQCPGDSALVLTAGTASSNATPSASAPSDSSLPGKPRRTGISQASKRLVCSLPQELTLEAHFSKGFVEPRFVDEVRTLLDAYAAPGCTTKLRTRTIEIDTPEEELVAQKGGLERRREAYSSPGTKVDIDMRSGFSGFVVRYGTVTGELSFWPPKDTVALEYFLTSEIRELTARVEGKPIRFGCVAAKGTECFSNPIAGGIGGAVTMKNLLAEYCPYYELVPLDLSEEIPDGLVGILVTQPAGAFLESEIKKLDAYLMRGNTTLATYVSAVNIEPLDRAMKATLSTHGLEPLLRGYGITSRNEVMWDDDGALSFSALGDDAKPYTLLHPPTMVATGDRLDTSFAPFTGMLGLPFPFASPLEVHREKQPEAAFRVIARTTKTAHTSKENGLALAAFGARGGDGGGAEHTLAVAVEGKLKSAFSAKVSRTPSRLLVVSSSQFFGNPFTHAGSAPPVPPQLQMMGGLGGDPELLAVGNVYATRYFARTFSNLKNTLDWIAGEPDYAELTADLLVRDGVTSSP